MLTWRWVESRVELAEWYVILKGILTEKHRRKNSQVIKVCRLASSEEEIYTQDNGKLRSISTDTSPTCAVRRIRTTLGSSEIRASRLCSFQKLIARVWLAAVRTCSSSMIWVTEVYCTIKWASSLTIWTIREARRVYMEVGPSATTCQFTLRTIFRIKAALIKNRNTMTLAADIKALTNKMILLRYTWFQTSQVLVPYQISLDKIKE